MTIQRVNTQVAAPYKFKVGDRVRRDPKVWKKGKLPEDRNCGVVKEIKDGHDNKGRGGKGYVVVFDADKNGVEDSWTGKIVPAKGQWYLENELVKL